MEVMALNEAIQHCEEVAKENREDAEDALDRYNLVPNDITKQEHNRCKQCATEHSQLAEWLKELKLLREQTRWIPCGERLPQEETDVLVTRIFLGCKDGSYGWNNHIPPSTYVEVAQYFNGEWTALSDEYKVARSRHTNPVAWMPMPEPYKAESEK